jgi:hypothetical protein
MPPSAPADPQPSCPARTKPNVSTPSPTLEVRMPTGSSAGGRSLRDSGSSTTTATIAIAMIGRFIRNTQPHQKFDSSQPPTIGPSGSATKFAAAQMPTARGRSSALNSTAMPDSTSGITSAAPNPSTACAAMNAAGVVEVAASTEPPAYPTSAISSIRLRPNRSPSRPPGSTPAASTSV